MRRTLLSCCFALSALSLLGLAGCSGGSDAPAGNGAAGTREVLVVSNNWDGTADFIDSKSFARLLRLNIIPDAQERMLEILSSPDRLGYFLAIQQLVGEGHNQYVDDSFTSQDGRYLYVSRPSFADVVAFDLVTQQIVWRAPVEGYRADHMAISPDGQRLAVSASTARKAHIIDTASGQIVGSFDSGDQPHENNYSQDGKLIFHASIGTIYTPTDQPVFDTSKGDRWFQVVDANTFEVLKRVDIGQKLAEAGYPDMSSAVRPMAIAPDERHFYFQVSFFHGFVEYDLQEDRILRVANLPKVTTEPRENYQLDSAHHGLAMNLDGSKLCAAATMDGYAAIVSRATLDYTVVPVGPKPYWSTTSTDGRYCFVSVSENDEIGVIDYASEQQVGRIPVGDHPQRSRMGRVMSSVVEAAAAQ